MIKIRRQINKYIQSSSKWSSEFIKKIVNKIFKYIDMHCTQSKQICNYVNNCPVQSVSLTKN